MNESDNVKPTIQRDKRGRFPKGVSGNPAGAPRRKLSSREARERLPEVVERTIRAAIKDSKWLDALRQESPTQFASVLTTLTRYVERDEPPPPAEESMSNAEAMDIVNQIKKEAYLDGYSDGKAGKNSRY